MQTGPGDSLGIRWYADSEVQDVYPLVTERREKWNDDCPICFRDGIGKQDCGIINTGSDYTADLSSSLPVMHNPACGFGFFH